MTHATPPESGGQEARQLHQQAIELYDSGHYREAIPSARRALALNEAALGAAHLDVAAISESLAKIYHETADYARTGNHAGAEAQFKRAIAVNEKVAGSEHVATAGSLTQLAGLYRDAGAYAQAEPLYQRELVVLSACDTAVGEVQNGEGVYGLRRALALAGAQTQITSLWKVSDAPTRTLMVDYYRRLLAGEGRSAALRQAQRALLNDPELAHPYYWASLVRIGNWNPLPALREQR
jgi:tetratricopeptide (TPR) repeat protein